MVWSAEQGDCKCIHYVFSEHFCILRKKQSRVQWLLARLRYPKNKLI